MRKCRASPMDFGVDGRRSIVAGNKTFAEWLGWLDRRNCALTVSASVDVTSVSVIVTTGPF